MSQHMSNAELRNRANQLNPNHWRYWKARGYSDRPSNWRNLIPDHEYDPDDSDARNNTANQNNPNHKSYWTSRGYANRPSNWRSLIGGNEYISQADEMGL